MEMTFEELLNEHNFTNLCTYSRRIKTDGKPVMQYVCDIWGKCTGGACTKTKYTVCLYKKNKNVPVQLELF